MRASPLFAFGLVAALAGSVLAPRPAPSLPPGAAGPADPASVRAAALPPAGRSQIVMQGPLRADLVSVIDGDTIEVLVRTFIDQTTHVRVRLRGIDAPELSSTCAEEHQLALGARNALAALLATGHLTLTEIGRDKYAGRVVARVLTLSGEDAGAHLLAGGYAIIYDGGRRQPWCETRLTAQR